MSKKTALVLAILFCGFNLFSQGAGNWAYQNKKSSVSFEDEYNWDFGGENLDNSGYTYQYEQAAYTNSSDTVIYMDVRALMNVKPDTYIMIIGLSQISEDLGTCFTLIDDRIATFLTEAGISDENVYVDFISQTPIFARKKEKKIFSKKYVEVPKGFEIKKNIHIKFTDRKDADKYLKFAAKNEIYDIIKVDYIVSDHAAIYDILRKECLGLLNKQMADYELAGISFEADYKSLEESNSCTYPITRYSSFSSYMPTNYESLVGNDTDINLVNPNEYINIFYEKLPYTNYDIIINPDVVEPTVQFSQYIKLKFVLKKK
jgi:hypothetical protein